LAAADTITVIEVFPFNTGVLELEPQPVAMASASMEKAIDKKRGIKDGESTSTGFIAFSTELSEGLNIIPLVPMIGEIKRGSQGTPAC
jgi:hypothetical protein